MKRNIANTKASRHPSGRTNLISIIFLVVILSGILLFFTNEKNKTQIVKSFCGDFGFYGKSLVLMRDSTFRFNYYGCSQTNGYLAGNWSMDNDIVTFSAENPDENLDTQYRLIHKELIPINDSVDEKFILCEDYRSYWE